MRKPLRKRALQESNPFGENKRFVITELTKRFTNTL